MYDQIIDKGIEMEVNANNVFDAIDIACDSIEHPKDTILESANLID